VKALFDTSVLVASSIREHPSFAWSSTWVKRALRGEIEGFISTHSMAELFAILTAHPKTRFPVTQATQAIEALLRSLQPIALDASDYRAALARAAELKLTGGAIYDILHAQAFLKSGADSLVTLNTKHFVRLGQDIAPKVEAPD
jgi:predicted nucleic acid-binding protein